jgi:hypothetical protein
MHSQSFMLFVESRMTHSIIMVADEQARTRAVRLSFHTVKLRAAPIDSFYVYLLRTWLVRSNSRRGHHLSLLSTWYSSSSERRRICMRDSVLWVCVSFSFRTQQTLFQMPHLWCLIVTLTQQYHVQSRLSPVGISSPSSSFYYEYCSQI